MEKKTTFRQEHLVIDMDDHQHYMIVVELENNIPVRSFTVKMPEPCLTFPSHPNLFN